MKSVIENLSTRGIRDSEFKSEAIKSIRDGISYRKIARSVLNDDEIEDPQGLARSYYDRSSSSFKLAINNLNCLRPSDEFSMGKIAKATLRIVSIKQRVEREADINLEDKISNVRILEGYL